MKKDGFALIAASLVAIFLVSGTGIAAAEESRPEGWDDYSHGDDTEPDYAVVFPENEENTIIITPENWQMVQEDITSLYGEFGSRGSGGFPEGFRGMFPGQQDRCPHVYGSDAIRPNQRL